VTDATTAVPPDRTAIRRLLSAVQEALDLPAPVRARDQLVYLRLVEKRALLVGASFGRLTADPHSDALDYASEAEHILHQLADLPPVTYRHHAQEL
jgi:hypothetical protein